MLKAVLKVFIELTIIAVLTLFNLFNVISIIISSGFSFFLFFQTIGFFIFTIAVFRILIKNV